MKLGINIDHVATIRQARHTPYPNLPDAARAAEDGGADFITVHLREDRRHITDEDLPALQKVVRTYINFEMAAVPEMQNIALEFLPRKICLVPERRAELTTEGGLDAHSRLSALREFCAPLAAKGMEVSLFIAPDIAQVEAAAAIGVPAIELHTGEYARSGNILPLQAAVAAAVANGLKVHAGHGLHLQNTAAVAAINGIVELNIGHAIIARALFVGLQKAVAEMAALVKPTTQHAS